MDKQPVKDLPGLFRTDSGAIINCSDSEYNTYMEAKKFKLKELQEKKNEKVEIEQLKSEVEDLKDMIKLVLNKLDK
jgi:cell shape-determining protein MreC